MGAGSAMMISPCGYVVGSWCCLDAGSSSGALSWGICILFHAASPVVRLGLAQNMVDGFQAQLTHVN